MHMTQSHNGGEDVFIAIFNTGLEGIPYPNPGLEILKSTTFIGGSGNERPYAMALRTEYPPHRDLCGRIYYHRPTILLL